MFNPGDKIVKSCRDGFSFHGWVLESIPPEKIREQLKVLQVSEEYLKTFDRRDPTWRDFPIYVVQTNSSPGPAPYEEACQIIPGLTIHQYNLLMHYRKFIVLDSDLLPELEVHTE